jgi:hypothetical protein
MGKKGEITKTCIRCGRTQPAKSFWSGRPTCVECARKLWYAPKCDADPRRGPNWPMMERMVKAGLISYPKTAFENTDPQRPFPRRD